MRYSIWFSFFLIFHEDFWTIVRYVKNLLPKLTVLKWRWRGRKKEKSCPNASLTSGLWSLDNKVRQCFRLGSSWGGNIHSNAENACHTQKGYRHRIHVSSNICVDFQSWNDFERDNTGVIVNWPRPFYKSLTMELHTRPRHYRNQDKAGPTSAYKEPVSCDEWWDWWPTMQSCCKNKIISHDNMFRLNLMFHHRHYTFGQLQSKTSDIYILFDVVSQIKYEKSDKVSLGDKRKSSSC